MAIDNKDKKVLKSSIEREQNEPACSAEREKIKGSKNLNVPHLRFPEFSGEWDSFKLVELGKFIGGGTPSSSNLSFWTGSIPWISSSDIKEDNINNISISRYITEDAIEKSATKYCPAPVILIVSRVGVGKVALSHTSLCTSQDFCNIIEIKCHPVFLSYNLLRTMKRKSREVQGTSIKGITSDELQKIRVFIPKNKDEQNKISNLLTLLDERIATQNKIIERYESLIRGIMVELQKQGLKRGTWKKVFLNDILKERNERNSNLYQVFSVSVSQGIINQVDHLGRSFSAKDTSKYNVVHYGDLVYTKSPTGSFPYGIVKQSLNHESVAVSPLYGVYVPDSLAIGIYLHKYFMSEINTQNYLHPLIQKGAKNTINITNQRFLENRVPMPLDSNELLLISKLLRSLNDEIRHEQNMLQEYQKQKQYLLRQMFI